MLPREEAEASSAKATKRRSHRRRKRGKGRQTEYDCNGKAILRFGSENPDKYRLGKPKVGNDNAQLFQAFRSTLFSWDEHCGAIYPKLL